MRSTFPLSLPLTHCSAPHSVLNIAEVLASAQQPCAGERSGSASGTLGAWAHLISFSALGSLILPPELVSGPWPTA